MSETDPLPIRVYSEGDGKVYLLYEPKNWRVEVGTPVTEETLEAARLKLQELATQARKTELITFEGDGDGQATSQQLANRQIKEVVEPAPIGFSRFIARLGWSLLQGVSVVGVMLMAVSFISSGVRLSEEHLPEILHWLVLFVYIVGLALCIYLMATEEIRRRQIKRIKRWFGPNGLLFLPVLTLIVAAAVFASLTFALHKSGWVVLEQCSRASPTASVFSPPVSTGSLLDFYMWHFFKLVPLLKLNETLKWGEPLCYTQGRVGFLILLFQALVVLPSINTVRFYWRNRQSLNAKPYKYVYEPGWKPESNLEP